MRTIKTAIIFAVIAVGVAAARSFYAATLFSGGFTYNRNLTINLATVPNSGGTLNLSAQAIYSTTTLSTASFTDGRVSTGSATVLSNSNLASQAATNQITIAATSVILAASATDYLVVLSTKSLTSAVVTYNGNPLKQGSQWFAVSTTTGTAESIKTAINRFSGVTATRTGSEVDLVATAAGAAGNSKTLAVNTSSITIGGSNFGGGHNNRLAGAYLTVKGLKYWQGGPWSVMSTSSGTATSVATFLNTISGVRAAAVGSVVYTTATVAGTAGNAFTLASSAPSYMTVAGANFSGGRNAANVCVNGTCVTQGTNWSVGASTAATLNNITAAVIANSTISSIVTASSSTSVLVLTAKTQGPNYSLTTNAPTSLTLSGSAMTGGTAAAWSAGSVITIPAHGFSTGLGVVYSTSTGTGLFPLVRGTTYYVGVIDANDIALSSTSAQSQVGTYIGLTAPGVTGPHTFNLAPQAISGTPSMQWQVSNDCVNYSPLDTAAPWSFPSPYTAGTQTWDFGKLNYKCVRVAVTGPTTGEMALTVLVSGN